MIIIEVYLVVWQAKQGRAWSRNERRKHSNSWFFYPSRPSFTPRSPMTKTKNHNTTVYGCRFHAYSFRHLFHPQTRLDSSGEVILNIPGQLEPWRRPHPYLAQTHWPKWTWQVHEPHQRWRGQILAAHIEKVMDELPEEQDPEIQEVISQSARASMTNENERFDHQS